MTTIWKVIPSCPNYEASDSGHIRRATASKKKRAHCAGYPIKTRVIGGYNYCNLFNNGRYHSCRVPRLMLEAFNGSPPDASYDAAHNDGNGLNDALSNLRWASKKSNQADRWLHGTRAWGERVIKNRKLTMGKAESIRFRIASGESVRGLSREYGVNRWTIKNIVSGKSWRDKTMDHVICREADVCGIVENDPS